MIINMNTAPVELELYCQRIGYDGERAPTLTVLRQLCELHTGAIAFENLSSLAGEQVPITLPAIQDKLLVRGRGGYCFEHNSLLWNVLEQFGFMVRGLAARVRWNVPDRITTPIGHMVLKVRTEQQDYLVDVGFGGMTVTAPLQLNTEMEQNTTHEPFRITRDNEMHTLSVKLGEAWKPLYAFDLNEFLPVDYEVWNWFTCTAPASPFIDNLMVARPDSQGRHALNNNRYTYRARSGAVDSRLVTSVSELRALLTHAFQIRLPDSVALDTKLAKIAAIVPP